MRVMLLNPPFLARFSRESRSPAVAKSGTFYYPMWLAYATGVLEQDGFDVRLIDAPAKGRTLEQVEKDILSFDPALIVLDTSTPSIDNDLKVLGHIKRLRTRAVTLLVGRHVSALSQQTMASTEAIDAIAIGEYDYTVRDLARAMRDGLSLETVKGLLWRDRRTGQVRQNEAVERIEDLDAIPFVSSVYLRHVDHRDYFYGHSKWPIVTIVTGRGCPHRCFYCCYPQTMYGHKLRQRSPQNVAAEFEFIRDHFPDVKEIMLEDDTLTISKRYVSELADALIAVGNKIPFSANARADITDVNVLKKLKKAGCRLFCVGFESGVQEILDNIHKKLDLEKAYAFSKATKAAGIMVHGCFMVGNPGETEATMEATLEYAKRLNPDTAQFYPLMVYPGTEGYEWAKREGYLLTEDYSKWLTEEGLHATILERPGLSSEYLNAFCDRARREFYLRPRYLLRKGWQSLFSFDELERNLKGFRNLMRYLFRNQHA